MKVLSLPLVASRVLAVLALALAGLVNVHFAQAVSRPDSATLIFPPGSSTNMVITVPENKAVRLSCNVSLNVRKGGVEVPLPQPPFNHPSQVVQGPAEVVFSTESAAPETFITYQIFPSTALTMQVHDGEGPISIPVPAGKILKIVSASQNGPGTYAYTLRAEDGTVARQSINSVTSEAVFYAGPITVQLGDSVGVQQLFITYFFSDDLVVLPEGVLETSGASTLTVEKSTDLKNWTTAGVLSSPNEPKTFYRLKASQ